MGEKELKLKKIFLKKVLPQIYIKYFTETKEDIDKIVDAILKDLNSRETLSETEKEDVFNELLSKMSQIDKLEGNEIVSELVKESQRNSQTWENVQKAKEIMKELTGK